MTTKRLFLASAFAFIAAVVPIRVGGDAPFDLKLSAASCDEGDCGRSASIDCDCPDLLIPFHFPLCDSPPDN